VTVAAVPLKVTVFALIVVPKFVPVIVTEEPTAPDVGERLDIVGVAARAYVAVPVSSMIANSLTAADRQPARFRAASEKRKKCDADNKRPTFMRCEL
jgi:hypothetical protein